MGLQVVGAHVLVCRGGCDFLAKARTVSSAGGFSAIIVDDGPGGLRMEAEPGERVEIPVVMISKLDGKHVTDEAHAMVSRRSSHGMTDRLDRSR